MEISGIYRAFGDIQTVVEAKAPMGMRWGIIGTEALSPRLREAEKTACCLDECEVETNSW